MSARFPLDAARELYAQGHTLAQIAERYGVSIKAVQDRLVRAGIPRRPPGRALAYDKTQVLAALMQGARAKDVAELFGISAASIRSMACRARQNNARRAYVLRDPEPVLDAWAAHVGTIEQIAAMLDMPAGTVRTILRKARLAGDPRAAYRDPEQQEWRATLRAEERA